MYLNICLSVMNELAEENNYSTTPIQNKQLKLDLKVQILLNLSR